MKSEKKAHHWVVDHTGYQVCSRCGVLRLDRYFAPLDCDRIAKTRKPKTPKTQVTS